MTMHRSDKIAITVVAVVAVIILVVLAWAAYVSFIKEWPHVTSAGEARIIGSDVVAPGGDLQWVRDEVCLPEGRTVVTKTLEPFQPWIYQGSQIINSPAIGSFTLDVTEPVCVSPSQTIVVIPSDVYPGKYRIRVDAATDNPSLWPSKSTAYSPWFNVSRNAPSKGASGD